MHGEKARQSGGDSGGGIPPEGEGAAGGAAVSRRARPAGGTPHRGEEPCGATTAEAARCACGWQAGHTSPSKQELLHRRALGHVRYTFTLFIEARTRYSCYTRIYTDSYIRVLYNRQANPNRHAVDGSDPGPSMSDTRSGAVRHQGADASRG